ncbi:MAG: hypothetical protein A3K19_03630 [Lentisphaerae bacterium RIFOXYB12_FULL_65_16]|nr:MAG: hypothetical protein A3K18_30080 [Lentisphaerae bacterium RIFOXYA12_64_32]OGV86604.1 MAG: hypothetical protein A3K19_03630 [Lentisphaerae bacterium RIFOXYB12_FULL_65_16]
MKISFACNHCRSVIEADTSLGGGVYQCPQCGKDVHVPTVALCPGMTLGNFEIQKKIGSGGMGDVFLAKQMSMDRLVALKVLAPSVQSRTDLVQRFMHEVRILARLEHPNIVTAFEAGKEAGQYYLAMSFVDGETLGSILKRDKAMPEVRALMIAEKVARALSFAWDQHKILHRDIKPANIMIDKAGEVKLMDLGIGKSLADDAGLTMTGALIGTPSYMSPEQARGATGMDFRADIYALGGTLYNMVAGSVPYTGDSILEIVEKHKSAPVPDAREANGAVSQGCSRLIQWMMAKDPAERPGTWQEVLDAIAVVVETGSLQVKDGRAVAASSRLRKVFTWAAVAAAVLMAGLFCLVLLAALGKHLERKRQAAAAAGATTGPAAVVSPGNPEAAKGGKHGQRPSFRAPATAAAAATETSVASGSNAGKPPPHGDPGTRVPQEQARQIAELSDALLEARRLARENPNDHEGNLRRFEEIRRKAVGSPLEDQALVALKRMRDLRRSGAVQKYAEIDQQARDLEKSGKLDEALAVLQQYDGPFRSELAPQLQQRVAQVKASIAAREEQRKKEPPPAEVLNDLLDGAVRDLLERRSPAQALQQLEAARTDSRLQTVLDSIEAAIPLVSAIPQIDRFVLESLQRDVGKKVTLSTKQGNQTLTIKKVPMDKGADAVIDCEVADPAGRGSFGVKVLFKDLSAVEKARRLPEETTPTGAFLRGTLAYYGGNEKKAGQYYTAMQGPFGAALIRYVDPKLVREGAADPESAPPGAKPVPESLKPSGKGGEGARQVGKLEPRSDGVMELAGDKGPAFWLSAEGRDKTGIECELRIASGTTGGLAWAVDFGDQVQRDSLEGVKQALVLLFEKSKSDGAYLWSLHSKVDEKSNSQPQQPVAAKSSDGWVKLGFYLTREKCGLRLDGKTVFEKEVEKQPDPGNWGIFAGAGATVEVRNVRLLEPARDDVRRPFQR